VRRARSTCTPAQRPPTATARWEALGTSVVLRVTDPMWLPRASAILARELDAIDRACSRFREDSDLTRVNTHAGGRPVPVAPLLIEALQVALRAAELTGGDVDPTVGAALVLAETGSDGRGPRETPADGGGLRAPSPPTLIARRLSGHRTVQLDATLSTVRIPSGIMLDLGATAKAWAADRGARAVWETARCGVLVSLGGDIAIAGGVGSGPAGGWRIHVTDDHRSGPDAPGQTVAIADGGLATSSVAVRRWQRGGQTMHHIIDPSSGAPARGPWRTVSVAAANCTDANIAATAALVRGRGAPAWLDALGLPARLVAHDGAVLRLGDWPLDGVAPTARPDRISTVVPLDPAAVPPDRTPASVVGHGCPTPQPAIVSIRRVDDLQ
jgi:thiamine biosynthesis lipoprotein ApbE